MDPRTFDQILQVMVQQAAVLDNQQAELERLRRELKQGLHQKDKQLRLAESQAASLQKDLENALTTLERTRSDYAALKAAVKGRTPADSDVLPLSEHRKIVQWMEQDSRRRITTLESEKGEIVCHVSQLRIEVAQLRNQLEERQDPEEVGGALYERLKDVIERSFIDSRDHVMSS